MKAAVRKRETLAARADVTPPSAVVLEMGCPKSVELKIDAHDGPVLQLQSQASPGTARTATEIKDSLHSNYLPATR